MYSSVPNDISILINNENLSSEFHICEVGYEKCRSTKPTEYAPIDYWVIHYCIEGEGFFSTPFFPERKITAGDFFIIPSNCKNVYYPNREDPWQYRWVGFTGKLMDQFFSKLKLDKSNCVISHTFDHRIDVLFQDIYESFKKENLFCTMASSFILFDTIDRMNLKTDDTTQSEHLFKNILNYIDDNMSENLSVNQISEANSIDRTYLYKLFQTHKGIGPSEYIQNLKLQKACSLLRKSSLTITEIAYETGFSSSSYFSKFFHSKLAISPSTYRKQFIIN
ncbi:AraC family transcriptional regulator [Enterococcus hulanensis]|uniref:AraC family transcriptional regulator n=1 Tax=Enterococcus hulanensis TaxID=2559929 RepID=UPI001A8D2489|nr:AraC family transcriptional regulator [Enterococcus hulanensis]MBO0457077.1 AraC family transcriptional regulator [Enterococcus hulanensis]